MSEVLDTLERAKERPFPWFCPRCRKKDVWREVIRYQCQRLDKSRPVDVVVPDLAVPRCRSCGELVFDYAAESQINARSAAMGNLGGFLMQLAAKGVAAALGAVAGPVGIVAEEAINHFGRPIVQRWWDWLRGKPRSEQEEAFQEFAKVNAAQSGPLSMDLVRENAPDAAPQTQEIAARFLAAMPGAVRRSLVLVPGAGARLSLPHRLQLQGPDSLLPLLPISAPPFTVPGDLPDSNYRLEEVIGTGGFGVVYRASSKDPSLRLLHFAVKVCLNAEMQAALNNERELLERLQTASSSGWSERIVKLYGYRLDVATPYLVYELVPGGDLASHLERRQQELGGRVEPAEVRGWVLQIVEGLAFAHSQGLIHRDLKPANVLIAKGSLKLADFGLGGVVAGYARSHSHIRNSAAAQLPPDEQVSLFRGSGTPLYMSPEQRRGDPPDPRHDLYSLGVMWYQLLLGDVTEELLPAWKKVLAAKCPGVADHIELIERCLDVIDDRPANAVQLLDLIVRPPGQPASIRIESLQPQPLTVVVGSSATAVVRVARQNYDGPLDVTIEGLPAFLLVRTSPLQTGGTELQVQVTAARDATLGTLNAQVTVRGRGVQDAARLAVSVRPDNRQRGLQGRRSYRGPAVWVAPAIGEVPCEVIMMQSNQGNARV